MKFVTFYILTFLIVWEIASGGEFSQQDLHYIAERLNPLECSKLLKDLPESRKSGRKHRPDVHESSDYWESDTSRGECFVSLYECNERGKKSGCTKKWLVATLYKFGRADLAASLKKRWKKPDIKKDNSKKKNKAKQAKSPRPGRTSHMRKNIQSDTAKKIVKSEHRWTPNTFGLEPKPRNIFFDDSFVILVAAASFLILGFLATILFVAYRRACRCFKHYDEYHSQKEKKTSLHGPLGEEVDVCRNKIPDSRKDPDQLEKYTKFAFESDKLESEGQGLLEKCSDTWKSQYEKKEFLESVREPEMKRCKSGERKSKRKISPCARIKRFIDSQKRSLRGEKDKVSKKRKRKNCHGEIYGKKENGQSSAYDEKRNNKNGRRNFKTCSSPRNREKKGKTVRANKKTFHQSKSDGCTCDMCRLFNVKKEEECSERTNNLRDRKS